MLCQQCQRLVPTSLHHDRCWDWFPIWQRNRTRSAYIYESPLSSAVIKFRYELCTIFSFWIIIFVWLDQGYVLFRLKATTRLENSVLEYSRKSMVADIGSATGLLIGVSFLGITNVIDRLVDKYGFTITVD